MTNKIQHSSSSAAYSSISLTDDGDSNMTVIDPPSLIDDADTDMAVIAPLSLIGDGDSNIAVIAPPALMPTMHSGRNPDPAEDEDSRKKSPAADEEMGEEYSLHFGTTVIDKKGAAHHDPTMKLLFLGGSCLLIALVTIGVLLLVSQPWATESTGMADPIMEDAKGLGTTLVPTTTMPSVQEEKDGIFEPILEPVPKRAEASLFP